MASTIIMAPSTINPKSIAPRLIRFPLTPKRRIMERANNNDNGITEATTNPARQFPNNKTKTKTTIKAPSSRFFSTVLIVRSTNMERSRKEVTATPSGSDFLICSIFSFTSATTAPPFSPLSIITIPDTSSPSPSLVTAPYRVLLPICTLDTSLINIGMPLLDLTTIFSISLMLLTIPMPRIK